MNPLVLSLAVPLAVPLARVALSAIALVVVREHILLALAASLALYFAAFALAHDLMHRAFGLPIRVRDVLLALCSGLNLSQGHAMVVLHSRHHARPCAPDDVEGAAVYAPWHKALLLCPQLFIRYRVEAYRAAGPDLRRWQRAELGLNLMAVSLAWVSDLAALYIALALALQLSIPIWGGRIPHRAPRALVDKLRPLAFLKSPAILSLVFHDLHHDHPHIPCGALR